MENNTALNISCDFNGYISMPNAHANTVEVELKIKTTQGKYTLNKDTCMRTERYDPWHRVQTGGPKYTPRRREKLEGKMIQKP